MLFVDLRGTAVQSYYIKWITDSALLHFFLQRYNRIIPIEVAELSLSYNITYGDSMFGVS